MKSRIAFLALIATGTALLAASPEAIDPLPAAVSNNAVASLRSRGLLTIYSMMGIGPKKTWDAVSNAAYALDPAKEKWTEILPVPGTAGRIAASAAGARDHVFLFGGYVVDAQGGETTVSDVNAYDPVSGHWFRGADIPVPVDDAVVGVLNDRYVYLVGGWSKTESVRNVQIYDAQKNTWQQATPLPGTPVFGHAGSMVGETIVFVDGAYKNPAGDKPKYIASDECWIGKIDRHDFTKIQWSKLPAHPGTARYRIAAGGSERDQKIYFAGGTDNPYNYNGIGYNGQPAEPSATVFAFNLRSGKWETIEADISDPTMDHRGLVVISDGLVVLGGMEKGQKVTANVAVIPKATKGKK